MAGTPDDYPDRRRRRSPSDSSARDSGRRLRDEDADRSSRRRDEHRSSRRDSSRRRSSRSPSGRGSHRRDRDHRRREHRGSDDGDRRKRRHASPEERSHRRRRDRDAYDDRDKPSRRRRSVSRTRSPSRRSRSPPARALERSKRPLPSQNEAFTSTEVTRTGESSEPPVEKQKPNFANSGRLAAESNTVDVNGGKVVLKYHEPPEARKPPAKEPWRLYVFKGEDLLEVVELYERSCWLVGKERMVVDFPLEHPSCSKQHAAIQFRYVEKRNEFGDRIGKVKPYLIDLESANGSSLNGEAVPAAQYVEVQDKDVLRFGLSSREYVMLLPPPEAR